MVKCGIRLEKVESCILLFVEESLTKRGKLHGEKWD